MQMRFNMVIINDKLLTYFLNVPILTIVFLKYKNKILKSLKNIIYVTT